MRMERLPAHRLPKLPARMLEPPDLQWGMFTTPDSAQLRWCCLKPTEAWAETVIAVGFSEFIEKYFELMRDLFDNGISVYCFDWRGQGLSDRRSDNPARATPRNYDRDVRDLAAFTAHIGSKRLPRFLIAHSMGGAIGLRTLAYDASLFDAAVFSAPMVAVATGPFPRWIAGAIARLGVRLGFGASLIPGLGRMSGDDDMTVEDSITSHDPVRCTLMQAWFRANPLLKIDGVSFGWYDTAICLSRTFDHLEIFKKLHTPILIGTAGQDVFVHNAPIHKLAHTLPHATLHHFPNAKHELFHERDDIRSEWIKAVTTFLRSNSARPSP
jgi:lysophospholipase